MSQLSYCGIEGCTEKCSDRKQLIIYLYFLYCPFGNRRMTGLYYSAFVQMKLENSDSVVELKRRIAPFSAFRSDFGEAPRRSRVNKAYMRKVRILIAVGRINVEFIALVRLQQRLLSVPIDFDIR